MTHKRHLAKQYSRFFKIIFTLLLIEIIVIHADTKLNAQEPMVSGYISSTNIYPTATLTPVTWLTITNEIIEQFKDQGKTVTLQAIKIAECKSKLNPNAYNWNTNNTEDFGPFQINTCHISKYGDKFKTDYKENIRVAKDLYLKQKWNPWVCKYIINNL